MSIGLTKRQAAILRFVAGYQEAMGGISPSFREMAAASGTRSTGYLQEAMKALEERGHICRLPNRARAIDILTPISIPRSPEGDALFFLPAPHAAD